jgi:hypothetical protein
MAQDPRSDVERHSTEPNPETLMEAKSSLPFPKEKCTNSLFVCHPGITRTKRSPPLFHKCTAKYFF